MGTSSRVLRIAACTVVGAVLLLLVLVGGAIMAANARDPVRWRKGGA